MVSLIEGGLANGSLEKRELDLGDHLVGSTPKYKQRRVSAIRDFPERCGPNVMLVDSNAEGNGVVTVEKNSVGQEVMPSCNKIPSAEIEPQSPKAGLNPIEEADTSLVTVVGTTVSFSTHGLQDFTEEMKIDVQPIGLSFPNGVEKEAADVVKDINAMETFKESVKVEESLDVDNVIDEEAKPMLEVGSSVNGIGKETKPILEHGSSVQGTGEELKAMLEDGYFVNGADSVDILKDLSPTELKLNDGLNLDKGNPLGLKDKFRRRRVSAIRDFPPLCGPNVIGATGHTLSVHLGRNGLVPSSVSNLEIPLTETEIHDTELLESVLHGCHIEKSETKDASEGADKSMYLESELNDGNQESVDKEMVLHSQYRNQESKSPEIAQDTVVENVREVVHGMMAEAYCPGKQVKSEEMVLHSQDRSQENKSLATIPGSIVENDREVMCGMMAGPYCPWKEEKSDSVCVMNDNKVKKETVGWRGKAVAKKSILGRDLLKRKSLNAGKFVDDSPGSMTVKGSREYDANCGKRLEASSTSQRASSLRIDVSSSSPIRGRTYEVTLPPLNRKGSSSDDARYRVKDTLRSFQFCFRKILQDEESKSEPGSGSLVGDNIRRIDLAAASQIKKQNKEVNAGEKIIGTVPGVEVGDEFQYRVELAIVGVHRLYQGGIDYLNRKGKLLALSIVASGAYADDMENPDVLIYSGQGGNIVGKNKNPEDQKLQRGNLALKNSITERNPVRVIRGSKNKATGPSDAKDKIVTTYVYDGLYTVDRYYTETGPHGKMVFMFELRRMPGQPELSWKELKLSKKFKKRQGVAVDDISGGKETFPVCAVNTLNDEKPPSFTYITKMMYPDWFRPSTPKGCDCTGKCSSARKCACAVKNGGEIPYNYNGAIVDAKPIVFECGPSCKCPPSCYNRVTQRGSSIQLEIFKTESRGWGVRSLSFIPSGTFICEYTGEVLLEREAEKRAGSDEYLFDIGRNGNDSCKTEGDPDAEEDGGYTIDAAQYGNIGRFINHSCSPNLYAQDILYDHEDPKMPHVMIFAADNIHALQELTYDYNYTVDQVFDSKGNIKKKNCYCGSTVCTGRMY